MADGTEKDGPRGPSRPREAGPERCSRCRATLVEDQRYCLNCGLRRGAPRVDYTVFWKPALAAAPRPGVASGSAAGGRTLVIKAPSRRLSVALALGMVAIGLAAGVAIGPSGGSGEALAGITHRLLASGVRTPPVETAGAPAKRAVQAQAPPEAASAPATRIRPGHPRIAQPAASPAPAESTPAGAQAETSPAKRTNPSSGTTSEPTPVPRPPVTHVWLITLGRGTFGQAESDPTLYPYLEKTLAPQGTLLTHYTLVARSGLANDVALLSGQAPNSATEAGCATYAAVEPPTVSSAENLASGTGCVYPSVVQTLPNELATAGVAWRAYAQDMASTAAGSTKTCVHPALGEASPSSAPATGTDYVVARDPFVYFDSLLESGMCASNVVDLTQFGPELANPASAPGFSWIIPGACDDGASAPCETSAGPGEAPADTFVRGVVEPIMATSEYQSHGLIAITFDSAPAALESASGHTPVGALLLSPFVHHGADVAQQYDSYSLLKNIARAFGVPPLGHAADRGLAEFGSKVYTSGSAK